MNKIILALLVSFISVSAVVGQKPKPTTTTPAPELPVDAVTGLYSYSQVVNVEGTTKDELYKRALGWANGYYKNPGDVIREKSPEEGRVLIKARYKINNEPDKKGVVTQAGDVMYSLTFSFKDGKYKYEITKINWQNTSYYPIERWKDTTSAYYKQEFVYYLKQTDDTVKSIIEDFRKKIATPPIAKTGDW